MATTSIGLSSNDAFYNTTATVNDELLDRHNLSDLQRKLDYLAIRRQFHQFHRYFVSWIIPLYFVVGLVGTILCLVVLIRTKRRMHTPQITHWFIALSLSDVYVLVFGLLLMYVSRLHYFVDVQPIEPRRWNAFSCYSINILIYFGLLFSTWVQAGISVMRAFSTCMPLTVRVHLSSSRSLICLGATAGATFLTAFLMIRLGMRYAPDADYQFRCSLQKNGASQTFFYVSLILKVVLPWILLVLASATILSSLVRFRRSFTDCANVSIATSESTVGAAGVSGVGPRNRHQSDHWSTTSSLQRRLRRASSLNSSRRSNRLGQDVQQQESQHGTQHQRSRPDSAMRKRFQQKRISYVLLGMNLSFLCFNLPFEVWKIYYDRNPPDMAHPSRLIINIFLNILVYSNNATNWLFYFMLGRRFRGQVRRLLSSLLGCGSQRYKRRGARQPMGPIAGTQRTGQARRRNNEQHQPPAPPSPQQYREHNLPPTTPRNHLEPRLHPQLARTNEVIRPSNGAEV